MVAVTNGRIVTVISHDNQAIIWLHRLNQESKITVNDLQTFGITCDVFRVTSEVGFLNVGANKRCIDSLEVRKKPGGHWIIRDLMGLDLVGLASL